MDISVETSIEFTRETGNIWIAVFYPMPKEEFLRDFDIKVRDVTGQVVYPFECYAIRRGLGTDGPSLEMRFRDRSWTLLPENSKLIAELHSPSA